MRQQQEQLQKADDAALPAATAALESNAQPPQEAAEASTPPEGMLDHSSSEVIERDEAATAKPMQQSLPPIIQQLLSKTARYRPPATIPSPANSTEGSASQALGPASSTPQQVSTSVAPVPQFGSMSPDKVHPALAWSGTALLASLEASASTPSITQFGTITPQQAPALMAPQPQQSSSGSLQPQPESRATHRPNEHIDGPILRPQPWAVHTAQPAESTAGPVEQPHSSAVHTDRPVEAKHGSLEEQPEASAVHSDRPAEASSGPTGQQHSLPGKDPQSYAAQARGLAAAPQRPRPQPQPRPSMVNGIHRPGPSSRPPPPGFVSRAGSNSFGPGSAQQAEGRKPHEAAPPQPQQRIGSVQTILAGAGREEPPAASVSAASATSHASSMPHSLAAANGSAHSPAAVLPQGMSVAQSSNWQAATNSQLRRKRAAKAEDCDEIPDSFCCPITQVCRAHFRDQSPVCCMRSCQPPASSEASCSTCTCCRTLSHLLGHSGEMSTQGQLNSSVFSLQELMRNPVVAADGYGLFSRSARHVNVDFCFVATYMFPCSATNLCAVSYALPHYSSLCCHVQSKIALGPDCAPRRLLLPSRHSYEASAIASWLENHDTSPMTNEEMSNKAVAPNKSLKAVIDLLFPKT